MIRFKSLEKSYPLARGRVFVLRRIDLKMTRAAYGRRFVRLRDGWIDGRGGSA